MIRGEMILGDPPVSVITAESAGFCFGVKRAMDLVSEKIKEQKFPLYTYGPLIHNETVVKDLSDRGVGILHSGDFSEPQEKKDGTVIIRSHGVSEEILDQLSSTGLSIEDATCPFVARIHQLVRKYSDSGQTILIAGNPDHPEVRGIIGWILPGTEYHVISSPEEAEALSLPKETGLFLLSQTTFHYEKFQEIVEILEQKGYDIYALNTICSATEVRQKEAARIAEKADVMLVIGGKNSSNTQKLFDICSKKCSNTLFVQTAGDLKWPALQSIQCIGITAGASTPDKIIEEVQKECQKKVLNKC